MRQRDPCPRTGALFRRAWPQLARIPVNESLVARAEGLVWEQGLRGYDAVLELPRRSQVINAPHERKPQLVFASVA